MLAPSSYAKFLRAFVAAVLLCGAMGACAPAQKKESDVTRAYRLIDAQRTDEAITLLEQLAQDDANNLEVRNALASAYAHKAGVKIQKLWKLVQAVKDSGAFFGAVTEEPGKDAISGEKIDASLLQMATALHRFARVAEIYAAIPNVGPDKRPFLDQAVLLLDSLKNPRPGDIVFRLILKIIQFKSSLASNMIPDGNEVSARDKVNVAVDESCLVDLERTNAAVVAQSQQLVSMLDDAALAFPDQEKALTPIRTRIAESASKLTSGVSSLIVFEMASRLALKASVVEHNFGKLLKCGGEQR